MCQCVKGEQFTGKSKPSLNRSSHADDVAFAPCAQNVRGALSEPKQTNVRPKKKKKVGTKNVVTGKTFHCKVFKTCKNKCFLTFKLIH